MINIKKLFIVFVLGFSSACFSYPNIECPQGTACAVYNDGLCETAPKSHVCSGPRKHACITYSDPGYACLNKTMFKNCLYPTGTDIANYLYCSAYDQRRELCMKKLSYMPKHGKC